MDNNNPNYPPPGPYGPPPGQQPQAPNPQAPGYYPAQYPAQQPSGPYMQPQPPGPYPQPQPNPGQAPYTGWVAAPPAPVGKKRGGVGLIVSVVIVLILVGAGAVGFTFFNKLANRPTVEAARLLPANTLAYLTISPNASGTQKEALDKIKATFESQPGFKEAWAKIATTAEKSTGKAGSTAADITDFDSLGQYLGNNLTIAVLPFSVADMQKLKDSFSSSPADSADVLMNNVAGVVDIDFNPLNKKGPLSDLKKQADNFANAPLAESYREIEIRKYITGTNTIYFSLLNNTSTAIVAGKPEPLHALIDQYKDNKGLNEDAAYKSLAGQVPTERMGSLYLNLTQIYKEAALADPEMLQNGLAKTSGAMLVTLSAQNDGLQVDVASQVNVEGANAQVNPNAKPSTALVNDVPSGSLGLLMGTDLRTSIQSIIDSSRKQSQVAGGEDPIGDMLNSMEGSTGLNLEKDVLAWMGGDYVLSAGVDDAGGVPAPSAVFQLKLSAADRGKAVQTVGKLVDSLTGGQAEKVDTAAGTFYSLDPSLGVVAGVARDRLLVVYDTDVQAATARVEAVMSGAGKGVAASPQWQAAAGHLPKDSNALMYLDIAGIRQAVEKAMPGDARAEYDQSVAPFLRPIKYLAMGSAASPGSNSLTNSHAVLFLGIGK